MSSRDELRGPLLPGQRVEKAVRKTNSLYLHWCEIQKDPRVISKEELDWTTKELKNSIKSIEWDLEDLEETIVIAEKNPKKFKLSDSEINERKLFINNTKSEVNSMKNIMLTSRNNDKKARQSLLGNSSASGTRNTKYTRLKAPDDDDPAFRYIADTHDQQQLIMETQDDQIDLIQGSVGTLKNMSKQIGSELEEQSIMLDDLTHEVETTDSKLDGTMKRMAKVLHMTNDKRQWMAIFGLVGTLVVVLVLFFVL